MVRQGHDVTLFASGDSETSAELVPGCERALRVDGCRDQVAQHVAMLGEVFRRASSFDAIHFHLDLIPFPLIELTRTVALTTVHGRLDLPFVRDCFYRYRHLSFASISNSQRAPMPWLDWQATVYHGLPLSLYNLGESGGDDLLFVGRISPEKRVDRAVEIARRAGRRLVVAAKVDDNDRRYFESEVAGLLREPHVDFLGEVGEGTKRDLLMNSRALLMPIDWPEPFGMVMIEAMASGTPVIAWRAGSVPEVVDPGITGIIVDSIDEAVDAVDAVGDIDRRGVRAHFEKRFSAERMATEYVAVYQQLCEAKERDDTAGREWESPLSTSAARIS